MPFLDDAMAMAPELTRLRRELHRAPEIGLDLPRTQERVLRALDGLPLDITLGRDLTSVVGVLRGAEPGPTVLLRADMDALPLDERTGLDFVSETPGTMHACGHDLHTTMLTGAAHLLSGARHRLTGDVVFMFQPGEEGCDGAGAMLAEGLLDIPDRRPDAAYAMHVFTTGFDPGAFAARSGPAMASTTNIDLVVTGEGGHASAPHRARDPIPALCEIVTALQTMVTRRLDPFDPVVVTIGRIAAGTRRNIIPGTASAEGTLRAFSDDARGRVKELAGTLVESIAHAHGVSAEITFTDKYPVTENDAAEVDFVEATVRETLGEEHFHRMAHPLTGAEDFSRVLREVPGAMVMLGAAPTGTDPATVPNNHSPSVVFDESVLPFGAALFAELAHARLERGIETLTPTREYA